MAASLASLALIACTKGDPAAPVTPISNTNTISSAARDFASGTRLHARAWNVDGIFVLRDFFDTLRNEPCVFGESGVWNAIPGPGPTGTESSATPTYLCLPSSMSSHEVGAGPYSDAKCTVPVALASLTASPYAIVVPLDSCASAPSIYRVGKSELITPYVIDGGACHRASSLATVYVLSDENKVALDQFASAAEHIEERGGNGRVASQVIVSDDGARQTIGGFDHDRSESVRFEDLGDDGRGNHLPPLWVPSRVAFLGAGEVLYSDAACDRAVSTKIARNAICPITAVRVFADSCGHADVYEIGPALDASSLFDVINNACVSVTDTGVFAFALGKQIAAAPAYVVEHGDDAIRSREYTSGGATVQVGDPVATFTGEVCTADVAIDGTTRCLPNATVSLTTFTDDACTIPALAIPRSPCVRTSGPTATARYYRATSTGEDGARVYEAGGEVATIYALNGAQCVQSTPVVPSQLFALSEVDVAHFPVMTAIDDTGD